VKEGEGDEWGGRETDKTDMRSTHLENKNIKIYKDRDRK
jgi:hypothetical protein